MVRMDSKRMNEVVKELYRLWRLRREGYLKRFGVRRAASYVTARFGVRVLKDQVWRLWKNFDDGVVWVEGDRVMRAYGFRGMVAKQEALKKHYFLRGPLPPRSFFREAIRRLQAGKEPGRVAAEMEVWDGRNKPGLGETKPQNLLIGPASAEAKRILCRRRKSLAHTPIKEHRRLTGELMKSLYRKHMEEGAVAHRRFVKSYDD